MTASTPIDSLHNTAVAAARPLLTRKGRAAAAAFLVEGPHAVAAALDSAANAVQTVFVTAPAAVREADLIASAAARQVTVRIVTERVLASLRDTVTPQGVVAVVSLLDADLGSVFAANPSLIVALEQIADPGNAGTVIRTADAAGADAVVATAGSVDVWSGKCVRATAGSLFHLPVVTDVSTLDVASVASQAGAMLLATSADGEHDLDDLIDSGTLAAPTVWVFGNEAHGISEEARAAAHHVVRLPIYGGAESLNLAAAAAICLYASARAQRPSC